MRATENLLINKHLFIDQSWPTGTLRADIYNRKSERRMGYKNTLFPGHQLWIGRHEARLQLCIFSDKSITFQNHKIALNVIISWKVRNSLIKIQQADIIILVLTFSSQLAIKDNKGTNERYVRCIDTVRFCPVKFNATYPANKNEVFSSWALDTFWKIWLIQVLSIATYGNKRLPWSDQLVLILK